MILSVTAEEMPGTAPACHTEVGVARWRSSNQTLRVRKAFEKLRSALCGVQCPLAPHWWGPSPDARP
jgi:hypothetical protein